jgi:hypothetical protein
MERPTSVRSTGVGVPKVWRDVLQADCTVPGSASVVAPWRDGGRNGTMVVIARSGAGVLCSESCWPLTGAALVSPSRSHRAAGDGSAATAAWQDAFAILVELDHPDADRILAKIGAF